MDEANNFTAAYEAGLQAQDQRVIDGHPYIIRHKDTVVESLEHLLPHPLKKTGAVLFDEPASFARYVDDHRQDNTALFASQGAHGNNNSQFVAILDYHHPGPDGTPDWKRHQAIYKCPYSDLWILWSASSGRFMAQRDFAEFIEANSAQIRVPSAAEFLEVAQSLTTRSTVAFTGSTRLDNGKDQLTFEATSEARAGEKGNLQVPSRFTIALPIYQGGVPWEVDARLRHRITDGKKLELKYELVNPQIVTRAAWDSLVETVNKATKMVAYIGRPA